MCSQDTSRARSGNFSLLPSHDAPTTEESEGQASGRVAARGTRSRRKPVNDVWHGPRSLAGREGSLGGSCDCGVHPGQPGQA